MTDTNAKVLEAFKEERRQFDKWLRGGGVAYTASQSARTAAAWAAWQARAAIASAESAPDAPDAGVAARLAAINAALHAAASRGLPSLEQMEAAIAAIKATRPTQSAESAPAAAPAAAPARHQSNALWPPGVCHSKWGDNISTDTHDSAEHAEAACRSLMRHGFGGDGKVFPLKVWVSGVQEPPVAPAAAPESAQALKDHEKRNLVTDLCAIAVQFHGHESLRCRIANRLLPALERTHQSPARVAVALTLQQAREALAHPFEIMDNSPLARDIRRLERASWAANHLTAPEGSR